MKSKQKKDKGRPSKFNEPSTLIAVRVPASRKSEAQEKVNNLINRLYGKNNV